ncbi:MAG: hypothetical protein DRN20_02405 [Thermoplasmata archaeon]|nr:MAG: hypothetical protein DRN20_02405 [Thermoplasmata archaeon]
MRNAVAGVALLVMAAFLFYAAVEMHSFGSPAYSDMDDYFIENAQKETGANNVVTSIVFDYRGFDTLGEATVLFTAVAGTTAVFKKRREKK